MEFVFLATVFAAMWWLGYQSRVGVAFAAAFGFDCAAVLWQGMNSLPFVTIAVAVAGMMAGNRFMLWRGVNYEAAVDHVRDLEFDAKNGGEF